MSNITVDFSALGDFITKNEFLSLENNLKSAHEILESKKNDENGFCGWVDPLLDIDEIEKFKKIAEKIWKNSEALIVIGIGGSYLGAKAIIELLDLKDFEIYFCGNDLSPNHLTKIIEQLNGKDFSINVISKSGGTIEPAIAFRIFKEKLERKYKDKAKDRIYVTTDKKNGLLRKIATKEGYETFVIPNNVGGRYSVLTPVGLFPIAVGGGEIDQLVLGAKKARKLFLDFNYNDCYKYAAARNLLYKKGKIIEIFASYEPEFKYFGEWYKQLFGESEGKDGKGIFPSSVGLTTDLHSMGQLIQDGIRNIFETVISVRESKSDIFLSEIIGDPDGLNYLSGKSLDYINKKACEGTIKAHKKGGVPIIKINLKKIAEEECGELIYFFERACAASAILLGVDPFNQPGVEQYKKNMLDLLKE